MNNTPALDNRRKIWTAPPRPEWVARMNAEAAKLDLPLVLPLDMASLLATAQEATGLSDFGQDDWREHLRVLLLALESEANLNFVGRLLTRNELLVFLCARLRVEDAYKRHPEIADEPITEPLLIIGQGRSGTSFLINLLAEHPELRAVRSWEAMYPVVDPPAVTAEESIKKAGAFFDFMNRATPELNSVHEFDALSPTESIHLMALNFVGDWLPGLLGQVPTFQAYMQPYVRSGIEYEKRVLKLLQWQSGRKRWVMKTPSALHYLTDVLAVYPDIRIAWAHRDPVKSLASVVSLQGTLNWVRSDQTFKSGAHEQYFRSDLMGAALASPIALLESGVLRKDRLAHVHYADLIRHPVATIVKMEQDLGYRTSEDAKQRLQAYLDKNRRSARPAHHYELGNEFDMALDAKNFERYQQYFDVARE